MSAAAFDPGYVPDDPGTAVDEDQLRAAEAAYERQYTHDGTPVELHSSCDHWWAPLTGDLDGCSRCGEVRDARA